VTPALFSVLFVSTGNVCRSPLAEGLLRTRLSAALGAEARAFRCESAGTWGHVGAGMEPHAADVLREHGADPGGFVARELGADQVLAADLILGATREHREQVRLLDPYAIGRTFSIREFARLAREVDSATLPAGDAATRARALTDRVAMIRTPRPGPGHADDDIADPFGAPLHVFRLCADAIAEGLSALVDQLSPASTSGRQRQSTA
jgi:protein-tyrosine phosphatase